MLRPRTWALAAALLVLAASAGCGGSEATEGGELLIVVNAPFSRTPALGETIAQGAELAAAESNGAGRLIADGRIYTLRVRRLDNGLSARRSAENVRRAIADGAIAVVDDGIGVDASWRAAAAADLPLALPYGGGSGLVDVDQRPNVFRIAPRDRGIAFRLAEYLVPKGLRLALLHDTSGYGREGAVSLAAAFGPTPDAVAARLTLAAAGNVTPQVLAARRSGATALLVWAQPAVIANVLFAARSAGWDVPVYAPPSGSDPLIRQQLADHPDWVDGLTFASGRMTAEVGPGPWQAFQGSYERAFGPLDVGVRTSGGKRVVQPPEYGMYSYDFVRVLAAAILKAGSVERADVLRALEEVTVRGANGDERGFNERSHEGVVDDDVYFARFRDMTFAPVDDDPLSSTLPTIPQTRS
jgi:ABC-type branched-subunit amino acid transport system substrate-binding protein